MIRIIIACVVAVLVCAEPARAGSTVVRCESPDGFRVHYGPEGSLSEDLPAKLTTGRDDFSGVNPVYIFDDSDAKTAKILWGGVVPKGLTKRQVESLNPTTAKTGFVIFRDNNQTTLIEPVANGLWLHSFYPHWQLGVFTRHTNGVIDRSALGSIFSATCTFTRIE